MKFTNVVVMVGFTAVTAVFLVRHEQAQNATIAQLSTEVKSAQAAELDLLDKAVHVPAA